MLPKALTEMINDIEEHKEEILIAFVTKYGFEPDECEIVTQNTIDGNRWYIRKKRNYV